MSDSPDGSPIGEAGAQNRIDAFAARVRRLGCFSAAAIAFSLVVALGTFTNALDGAFTRVQDRCREFGPCEPLPTPRPETLVGSLSEVRLGAARIPQALVWAERGLATPSTLTAADLAWPGRYLNYRVEFQGYGDAICTLRWTLIDAETGERVEPQRYGWPTVKVLGSQWKVQATEEDAGVGEVWVPYGMAGRFVVELELVGPNGVVLDLERSEEFAVTERDLPRLS